MRPFPPARAPLCLAICALAAWVGGLVGCKSHHPPAPSPWTEAIPLSFENMDGREGPVPAFVPPGLGTFIEEAWKNSTSLAAFQARMEAAAAQTRLVGSGAWPRVSLALDSQREQRNFIGLPIPGPGGTSNRLTSRYNQFGLLLGSQWELDLWGRVRRGREAAESDLAALQSNFHQARLSVAAMVVRAWVLWWDSSAEWESAQAQERIRKQELDWIQNRYREGLMPSSTLHVARLQWNQARIETQKARTRLNQASLHWTQVLGKIPSQKDPGFSIPLPPPPPPPPVGLPSELLVRRHDIRATEMQMDAAHLRVDEARAALLPAIRLTASGGTTSSSLKDVIAPDFGVWSLGANLAQPILEGGRLRAGIRRTEALEREALETYRDTVRKAFQEVYEALLQESSLLEQGPELEARVREAEAWLDSARVRHQSGLSTWQQVLEAERTYLHTKLLLSAWSAARWNARLDLQLALGGDFSTDSPPPSFSE